MPIHNSYSGGFPPKTGRFNFEEQKEKGSDTTGTLSTPNTETASNSTEPTLPFESGDSKGEYAKSQTPQVAPQNSSNQPSSDGNRGAYGFQTPPHQGQLIQFNFESHAVRAVRIEGEAYFVANDVCAPLGLENARGAVQRHCKRATKAPLVINGVKQEVTVIPRGDVFRLICKSQKPEAEKFERKVFDEWVPSIVQTGSYTANPPALEAVSAIKTIADAKREEYQSLQYEINRLTKRRDDAKKVLDHCAAIIGLEAPDVDRRYLNSPIHNGNFIKTKEWIIAKEGTFTSKELTEALGFEKREGWSAIQYHLRNGLIETVSKGGGRGKLAHYARVEQFPSGTDATFR